MKKNILSFIKNTYTKSFVLGLALAFIVAFSVQSVVASGQTLKFISQQSGLVNKIGSLTLGSETSASWIDPSNPNSRSSCITSKPGIEKETCLDVQGAGAFSKLMVLDIPAFITDTLFLNNNGDSSTISGLPGGLVLENTGGDDSIMATSLQLNDASGNFMPTNTTNMRGLCANNAGEFYPCDIGEPIETYHWDEGDWGACSAADSASCDGSWVSTDSGVCSGNYNLGICRESTGGCISGDISCNSGAWGSLPAYCQNLTIQNCTETTETACNANPLCGWIDPIIPGNCSARATSLECEPLVPIIDNCTWTTTGSQQCVGPTDSNTCLSQGGGIFPTCTWNPELTIQCSDSDPGTSNACTSQNDGNTCTWNEGAVSVATRDIVCKNSSNETVIDQFCIDNVGVKEPTSSDDPDLSGGNFCEVPVNAVCGNSVTNNQCSSGTYDPAPADSTTHYLWSCLGSNGGSDVTNCQEAIPASPIDGACDNATRNACSAGTSNDGAIADTSTYYRWRCDGQNGGSNSGTCQKQISAGTGTDNTGCSTWIPEPCNNYQSFLSGTKISMADGTLKDVVDIKIGDKVKTSDGIGMITKLHVYETDSNVYRMNTDKYFVTASHPFMTTEGWKSFDPESTRRKVPSIETNLLQLGDILLLENGDTETVTNLDHISGSHLVYNFSVDGTHDFYANGYWVHNK